MSRIALIAFLLAAASVCAAQESKPPTPQSQTDSSAKPKEKGELELAVEDLKKRGESLLTFCGENCKDPEKKISSGVINGKAIELVQPAYPSIARSAHASGQVQIMLIIDKEGRVMAAEAVSGHPLLFGAALRAAKASRFTPTLHEGKPVHVAGKLIYNFVAQ